MKALCRTLAAARCDKGHETHTRNNRAGHLQPGQKPIFQRVQPARTEKNSIFGKRLPATCQKDGYRHTGRHRTNRAASGNGKDAPSHDTVQRRNMNLHSDKEAFKEIIALAAEHFGYEQSHVEKDYWVSKILRDISLSEYADKAYFKGGTSLSKAYGLIERFSEDLDLFVFTGNMEASKQAEKTLNKKLSKYIIEQNNGIYKEELSETGGNYRKLYFSYDNVFQGVGLKEHLEVEIKSCDLPDKRLMFYPADKRVIKPITTAFLESIGQEELISVYGLESFGMQCINPRKTICDKISRLVKLSYNEDASALLAKHIRDVYDLTALYHNQEYKSYLQSDDFLEAMFRVTVEDGLNKNSRSHLSLADAPIFKDADTVMALPEVATAYTTDLRKLTFDKNKMPLISKAVEALKKIHAILIDFEEYRISKYEK